MTWECVKERLGLTSSDGFERSGQIKTVSLADLRRLKASRNAVQVNEFLRKPPRPGNRWGKRKKPLLPKNAE